MVDVFISYSRSDKAMVATLARHVEMAGYEVWWDADLPPHQSYSEVITNKIDNAKAAIVVWSESAVKSEWVRAEADLARNQRKLIQAAIGSITPPLPFNQIQYAGIGDWRGEDDHPGWRKVMESVADLCGKAAAAPTSMPWADPSGQKAGTFESRRLLFVAIGLVVLAAFTAVWWFAGTVEHPAQRTAEGLAAVWHEPAPQTLASGGVSDPNDIPLASRPNMVFPDSSTRLLQPADVAQLSPVMLKIAWGEILAREGFRFRDPAITDYFSRFGWYKPSTDQVRLNPMERRNVALLRQTEARYQ